MGQPKAVVSACLCGMAVRYDGRSCVDEELRESWRRGEVLAVCPECMGGLPIPREPAELQPGGRVLNRCGADCTAPFREGAEQVLALCRRYGITRAILKDGSPSCGVCTVYDGTFTRRKIPGQGVTAALLREKGIEVESRG